MSSQRRVVRYLVLGILGWLLASMLAFDFSALPVVQRHMGAIAQPSPETLPTEPPADSPPANSSEPTSSENGLRPFEEVTSDLEKQTGLFTTYSDIEKGTVYAALLPEQLNRNFLMVASIESGIGEAGLFRGWPLNDLLIQFREGRENMLEVVVPNTFIRNPAGQDWQQRLLDSSFSDSVIFAIKVVSVDPDSQAKLIDLSDLIVQRDLVNVSDSLSSAVESYIRSEELSYIDSLKVFDQNLELATTMGYTSSGESADFSFASLFGFSLQGLADSRGFSLGVRYSISALPENNGYQPRAADERVGYFLSAFRGPLQIGRTDPFVRYIHRWNLQKQQPDQALSAPKEPIVFWVENTVPPDYRADIEAGVLMWNEAFEQAGFVNAVEVRQMPNNADWDPADMRYNVIRWSDSLGTSVAGIGPSRVNPLTGEILDADVILDANVIRSLQEQYRTRGLESGLETAAYLQMCGQRNQALYLEWLGLQKWGETGPAKVRALMDEATTGDSWPSQAHCTSYMGEQQAAFGALAMVEGAGVRRSQLDTYLHQYLTMLTAHEVGHVLGLRHNFAGSHFLPPAELNDESVTAQQGMVSSLMDYVPPNIAPPGTKQGDFFPTQVGPYDKWAIEYGYKPLAGVPVLRSATSEPVEGLQQIAARGNSSEMASALAYAPDEDVFDFIDPEASPWDLSSDPLQFARWQMENAQAVWSQLSPLSVSRNEGFGGLRRRVDLIFRYFDNNTATLTNYVGGQRFRRLNPWEAGDRTPLEPIPAAKQREALNALNEKVFAADAFQFSPELLNRLPPDRWSNRGARLIVAPLDYPIYEQVLEVQALALSNLMSSTRLARVRDLEFKSTSDDVLTIAELFDTTYQGIWAEVKAADGSATNLSSLRRGLQRHHLRILTNLALRRGGDAIAQSQSFLDFVSVAITLGAPDDARVLARYQLRQIYDDVNRLVRRQGNQMEITTLAHWEEVRDRIANVLDASLIRS